MKKNLFLAIKIVLSIFFFVILFTKVNLIEVFASLNRLNVIQILLFLLNYLIAWFFIGLNFMILLSPIQRFKFLNILWYRMISWAGGQFTPTKIGELSMVYFMRDKLNSHKTVALLFIDNLISVIVAFLIAIFGLFRFFSLKDAILIGCSFMVLLLIFLFLFFTKYGRAFILSLFGKFAQFFDGFRLFLLDYFKNNKAQILGDFIVSLIKMFVLALILYAQIRLFGEVVLYSDVLIILGITSLISIVPFSLAGLGLRELSAVYLYGLVGVSQSVILLIYLVYLFSNYLFAWLLVLLAPKTVLDGKKD